MAASGKHNYVRILESVSYVCLQAAPCIQNIMQNWHTNQKTLVGLQPCLQPVACPALKGKPSTGKGSCVNCIQWGVAIENVYYPPYGNIGIGWQNINTTQLFDGEIEVAKSFAIRLSHGANPKAFIDFDPASILKIMMGFGEFHQNTQDHYDVIHKVSDIRNHLSHMRTQNIFDIDDALMAQCYADIDKLVECLITLTHFTPLQGEQIRNELNKIHTNPMTSEMEERAMQPLISAIRPELHALSNNITQIPLQVTQSLQPQLQLLDTEMSQMPLKVSQSLLPELQSLDKEVSQMPIKVTQSLQPELQALDAKVSRIPSEVTQYLQPQLQLLETEVSQLAFRVTQSIQPQIQADDPDESFQQTLTHFRAALKEYYQDEMGQLPLLPWLEDYEMKHIDDIFVDLELATKRKKLENYEALVTIKHPTKKNRFATRVLVLGDPGSGKTSLMSKIAYSWSQNHPSLAQFELVFYLRMRELHSSNNVRHCLSKGATEEEPDTNCSLLGEILQEMPQTDVDRDHLEKYIETNPEKILILLDGWDESVLTEMDLEKTNVDRSEHDIENVLVCKKQPSSCVIVTSRPYKSLGKKVQSKYYTSVNLKGFSDGNRNRYIRKFFHDDHKCENQNQSRAQGLIAHLNTSDDTLLSLARTPVMLMLICWMWSDPERQSLPEQRTELYYQFVSAIWARYCDREKICVDDERLEIEMGNTLKDIGLIAFDGIFQEKEILVFQKSRMKVCPDIGLKLGLLIEEKSISRHNLLRNVKSISFLHKSFQEFCAAYFIVNNADQLQRFLTTFDSWGAVLSKQEVLVFCCGLCSKFPGNTAAVTIIKHAIACCVKDGLENNDGEIHVGMSISRGNATKYNIFPVLNMINECDQFNQVALTESFDSLMSLDELSVHNNHPQTQPVFHKVVKCQHLFAESLRKIKKILFNRHPSASLEVISDTLRCMSRLTYIYMLFNVNDTSVPSEASMTQLAESITALSELQELRVCNARGPGKGVDVSVILRHLSKSPCETLTIIYFSGTLVGDAIGYLGAIITPRLEWLTLNDAALRDEHITELCAHLRNTTNLSWLEFSENQLGNSAMSALFAHVQFLPKLTHLYTSASIDCHCSPLVKECVAAAGQKIPSSEACEIGLRYEDDAIQSLLSISRGTAKTPLLYPNQHNHKATKVVLPSSVKNL